MLARIWQLLPHASILICNMYIVFYMIDRVNTAMCFIDNGLTKGLLVIMCLISILNSIILIMRSQSRKRNSAPRTAYVEPTHQVHHDMSEAHSQPRVRRQETYNAHRRND